MISPLLTDLYQLTMAYGYWKLGIHEREAVFHLIFRKQPFYGNYSVACGLATVIEFLQNWRFSADELDYLKSLRAPDDTDLFTLEFLDYLQDLRFSCDIDAIQEGVLVFPHEPLLRVKGPLLQGQLIESTLLNIINFQTLIATKSSRVCQAAQGDPVLEFGLRRAQGPDGALSASRAAYVGGCAATSNVLAGKKYSIPVSGTHAHSWVTAFPDEISAFSAYAEVMPHNCVLLVDTYDSLQGVKHAIEIGKKLHAAGAKLRAIRLDSGDLAFLSIKARELLDDAGFTDTQIIASNSLDEYVITQLKKQSAQISIWGVGTHLVTAYDHPAFDGVYKLSALRDERGKWQYKLKLSEQAVKVSNPGIHQVRRFIKDDSEVMDIIYDIELGISDERSILISLQEPHTQLSLNDFDQAIDLLQPVFRQGRLVKPEESIDILQKRALKQVSRFVETHQDRPYPVGLEMKLHQIKQDLKRDLANFPYRRVRSFVRRDSRMTAAQKRAFDLLMPLMSLNIKNGLIQLSHVFQREAPSVLEIGFGSGYSLLEMAKRHPEQNFIGIETHLPGIGSLLQGVESAHLKNIRVYYADAVEVLEKCIPDNSMDAIQIFFPDPWPKRKHHKRRLIQAPFVNLIVKKLKPGAIFHLATDWQDYAEHMMAVLSSIPALSNTAGDMQYANRSEQRPIITKFERRGQQSGRVIWELQFIKSSSL